MSIVLVNVPDVVFAQDESHLDDPAPHVDAHYETHLKGTKAFPDNELQMILTQMRESGPKSARIANEFESALQDRIDLYILRNEETSPLARAYEVSVIGGSRSVNREAAKRKAAIVVVDSARSRDLYRDYENQWLDIIREHNSDLDPNHPGVLELAKENARGTVNQELAHIILHEYHHAKYRQEYRQAYTKEKGRTLYNFQNSSFHGGKLRKNGSLDSLTESQERDLLNDVIGEFATEYTAFWEINFYLRDELDFPTFNASMETEKGQTEKEKLANYISKQYFSDLDLPPEFSQRLMREIEASSSLSDLIERLFRDEEKKYKVLLELFRKRGNSKKTSKACPETIDGIGDVAKIMATNGLEKSLDGFCSDPRNSVIAKGSIKKLKVRGRISKKTRNATQVKASRSNLAI